MESITITNLPLSTTIQEGDYFILEQADGTKKFNANRIQATLNHLDKELGRESLNTNAKDLKGAINELSTNNSIIEGDIYDLNETPVFAEKFTVETSMKYSIDCISHIYNNKIITIGGTHPNAAMFNKVYIYDMLTRESSQGANIPDDFTHKCIAGLGDKIVLFGGYKVSGSSTTYSDKIYIYNIMNNTWSTSSTNMPFNSVLESTDCFSDVSNNKIYIMNSKNVSNNELDVYCFSLSDNRIEKLSSTVTIDNSIIDISTKSLAIYNNNLYLVGGIPSNKEKYSLISFQIENLKKEVTRQKSAELYISKPHVFIHTMYLYVIGGELSSNEYNRYLCSCALNTYRSKKHEDIMKANNKLKMRPCMMNDRIIVGDYHTMVEPYGLRIKCIEPSVPHNHNHNQLALDLITSDKITLWDMNIMPKYAQLPFVRLKEESVGMTILYTGVYPNKILTFVKTGANTYGWLEHTTTIFNA